MTVRAWRITKARHAATAFTGMGAKVNAGRWNSLGVAVVYCAGSMSLALLEMLVHLEALELMKRYVSFELTFDDSLVTTVDGGKLPRNWRSSPLPASVQVLGDQWVAASASPVLQVPSALVPNEWNYILNPAHRDFAKITIAPRQPIKFDPRLIKISKS
jgi:RES domain-containing protein